MVSAYAELEGRMRDRLGGRECLYLPSCRLGLHLAPRHWCAPGGRVLMSPVNDDVILFVVLAAGLRPVQAPLDPRDGSLDAAAVPGSVWSGLSAVLTTNLYGNPDPAPELRERCDRLGVPLIEDAAHAIGSTVGGRPVGTYGEASVFSLSQHARAGTGGFLALADPALRDEPAAARDALLHGVFVSWAAAIALSTVPLAWLVFRRLIPQQVRADRDRETPAYREIGRFVAGDAAGAFFSLAMISLLPVMVAVRFDAAHNAFFYTAYTVGGTMEFMAINMASSLTAHASHSPESLAEGVRGALRRMVLLLVPVVLVLVLFAPLVLTPFGRGYTDHGSTVLRLLAAGALPRVAVELYIGVLRVQGRTGVLAAVQAGMCVLVLGGAAVLLGPYGIRGAGWAVLGGMTVTAAACAPGLRAVLKGREPGTPAAPDDDGYGTDWARRRARSRATAARDAVTPAYGTSVDAPRPRAPAPGPFSYGKNPTGSSPSHQTATRARGRTSATARELRFHEGIGGRAGRGAQLPPGPDLARAQLPRPHDPHADSAHPADPPVSLPPESCQDRTVPARNARRQGHPVFP